MRPLLIYRYENELIAKKDEFLELFMKEADEWEKIYLKEEYNEDEMGQVRQQRGDSIFRRIET